MQSVKNIEDFETLQVKNEVITIDEDEIQPTKSEEIRIGDGSCEINNGGNSNLIYYFEPQEKSNYRIISEDKSEW
jgi:hypothetical protein